MHYIRWKKYGDPLVVGRKGRPPAPPCSVEGCGRAHYARGVCYMHLRRLKRLGTVELPQRERVPHPHRGGYFRYIWTGHPLAAAGGAVMVHRTVLYESIGPGEHPCRWCGRLVDWGKSWPGDVGALVVDHLDHDRGNNALENLVASCQPCNLSRRKAAS
jgi:5-methylcytosine-specific restriction endonuclease McrA